MASCKLIILNYEKIMLDWLHEVTEGYRTRQIRRMYVVKSCCIIMKRISRILQIHRTNCQLTIGDELMMMRGNQLTCKFPADLLLSRLLGFMVSTDSVNKMWDETGWPALQSLQQALWSRLHGAPWQQVGSAFEFQKDNKKILGTTTKGSHTPATRHQERNEMSNRLWGHIQNTVIVDVIWRTAATSSACWQGDKDATQARARRHSCILTEWLQIHDGEFLQTSFFFIYFCNMFTCTVW